MTSRNLSLAGALVAGLTAGTAVRPAWPAVIARFAVAPHALQSAALPRGKKLILKDGSVQLVREYQVQGDRVRYYSLDRSQWEEIPEALVDWDATKKLEGAESKREAQLVVKAHTQDEEENVPVLDVDASLELAPGTFLPDGAGVYVFDGKHAVRLAESETKANRSKGNVVKQVLVPVPLVPSREVISIRGAHSKFRLNAAQPEFYIRTKDSVEPNVNLVRAKVHSDYRVIENLDELFRQKSTVANTIDLLRWQLAKGVYRYTLMKPLPPGEYAMVEQVESVDQSLYVWDFGVDGGAAAVTPAKTK
ncbi:MAG: hypothetical protein ACRD5R_05220 [Candidatus Acidiferrales bacterium]